MKRLILLISFILFISHSSVFAQTEGEEHLQNLTSGSDSQKIAACEYFGAEGDASVIPQIIDILSYTENPRLASSAAIALGYIQEKGRPTTALKDRIMTEKNPDVVYSSLLALMSIALKNEELEPDAKIALEHANSTHKSDIFIADLVEKINMKIESRQSEE